MAPIRALVALLAVLTACGTGQAAGLFDDTSVLELMLEGPLSSVIEDPVDRRERPFSVKLDGKQIDVAVRLRGKSRVVHCRFPPLRLGFARGGTDNGVFAGQDKLKLVTHCKGNADSEQNLLEEYAAYQLFNVLTDMSFRTRLLRVSYMDTDRPGPEPVTRFAFVVESDEDLARRLQGKPLAARNVSRTMLDEPHAALVYVFQYLIGNTDWSLVRSFEDEYCCHNGKLFDVDERNYFVPYDFDMSGLVSARYAKPQPELRLRSVRVRRYRGYCTDRAVLKDALRTVVRRRDQILGVIADLPGLRAKNRQKQSRYFERFFAAAEDEDKLLREFERRCL